MVNRITSWFLNEVVCYLYRILALEKLGAVFNQVSHPLQYTPRKFVIHQESSNLILIEADHSAYTETTKAQRKQTLADVCMILILYQTIPSFYMSAVKVF